MSFCVFPVFMYVCGSGLCPLSYSTLCVQIYHKWGFSKIETTAAAILRSCTSSRSGTSSMELYMYYPLWFKMGRSSSTICAMELLCYVKIITIREFVCASGE